MKTLLLALSSTFLLGGLSFAKEGDAVVPPETVLLEALKHIRDNKLEEFYKLCSTEKLCINDNSKKSIKTYNVPALQRRGSCLGGGNTITVNRVVDAGPNEKQLFIGCPPGGDKPFRLVLEGGKWLVAGGL